MEGYRLSRKRKKYLRKAATNYMVKVLKWSKFEWVNIWSHGMGSSVTSPTTISLAT